MNLKVGENIAIRFLQIGVGFISSAFRRVGAGKDGGRDVRSLQRLVLNRRLLMLESLAFATAVSNSSLRRDGNGNPGLDKATSRGRIDLLSAAVIAAGLAEPLMDRHPRRSWNYRGAA